MKLFLLRMFQNRLAKAGLLSIIAANGVSLVGLVNIKLLLLMLPVAQFGAIAMAQSFAMLMMLLCNMATWQPFITEAQKDSRPEQLAQLSQLCRRLDMLAALCSFTLAQLVLWLAGALGIWSPEAISASAIYALVLVLQLMINWPMGYLRFRERFHFIAWHRLFWSCLVSLGLAGLWWQGGAGLHHALWVMTAGKLAEFASLLLYARWRAGRDGVPRALPSQHWLELAPFQTVVRTIWASYSQQVLRGVAQQADTLVVGSFLGQTEAGYFKLIKNLALLVQNITNPLGDMFYPTITGWFRQHPEKAWHKLRQLWLALVSVGGLLLGPFALATPWLLQLFLGQEAPQPVVEAAWWYLAGAVLVLLTAPWLGVYHAMGWHWRYVMISKLNLLCWMGILSAGVQLFGLIGAGIAYLAYGALGVLVPLWCRKPQSIGNHHQR